MPFGREPTKRISVFSMKKLTAKEEMSSVAGSAARKRPERGALGEEREQHCGDERAERSASTADCPKRASSA